MNTKVALFQAFIDNNQYDNQQMAHVSLNHFHKHNPDFDIIITGHGQQLENTPDFVTICLWSDKQRGRTPSEGQAITIRTGVEKIIEIGQHTHILKTRLDTLLLRTKKLREKINAMQPNQIIASAYTGFCYKCKERPRLGDICNYAPLDIMSYIWLSDAPSGENMNDIERRNGKRFEAFINQNQEEKLSWKQILKQHVIMMDFPTWEMVDLRRYWKRIKDIKNWDEIKDAQQYFWGKEYQNRNKFEYIYREKTDDYALAPDVNSEWVKNGRDKFGFMNEIDWDSL